MQKSFFANISEDHRKCGTFFADMNSLGYYLSNDTKTRKGFLHHNINGFSGDWRYLWRPAIAPGGWWGLGGGPRPWAPHWATKTRWWWCSCTEDVVVNKVVVQKRIERALVVSTWTRFALVVCGPPTVEHGGDVRREWDGALLSFPSLNWLIWLNGEIHLY